MRKATGRRVELGVMICILAMVTPIFVLTGNLERFAALLAPGLVLLLVGYVSRRAQDDEGRD